MNLSELAQHLELSPTTVSRVLNGHAEKYRISGKTVDRVQRAANQFAAAPDPLGTSLRRGKLGMVGLLVPDITNPFFSGLARAVERELRGHNIILQLCDSAEDAPTELMLLKQMLGRRLDGLILGPVGAASPEFVETVAKAEMPIVTLDRVLPSIDVPAVSLDNTAAGKLAANYLIDAGHTRIGCLRGDHESFTDRERFRGYCDAMATVGLQIAPHWTAGAGYDLSAGVEGAKNILQSSDRPDALITLSGQGILAVLEVASAQDLTIPQDLSVIAFDDQPWARFVSPPLTTVVQPVSEMASLAVSELLSEGASGARHLLPATLCERESVLPRLVAQGG